VSDTSRRTVQPGNFVRWRMLAIICLGFFALTLNWFDAAAAFDDIGAEFHSTLGDITLLSSLFFIGYGVAHVPGGMLATRIGMKRTMVIGLIVQGIAGLMSGLSYHYTELAIFRVVSGLGGSIFIAVAFGAVMVWFKDRDVTVALGLSGGGAFSGGAAIALFIWVYLQNATSWHAALVIAGGIELIVALMTAIWFQLPEGSSKLAGVSFEWSGFLQSLRNRDLWIYGVALLGAYGSYFTVSQLFTTYAVTTRDFAATHASLLAATITLAGIPGAILGGIIADRITNLKALLVGSLFAAAILLALIPAAGTTALWFVGPGIGFFVIFGFAAWTSVPERVAGIKHEHVGSATGLMLTIAAVGGYFIPRIFGHVVPAHGYTYAWILLAIISAVFALAGLFARNPQRLSATSLTHTPMSDRRSAVPATSVAATTTTTAAATATIATTATTATTAGPRAIPAAAPQAAAITPTPKATA
jgi:ACS family D-galactonate transporter-like MFS transporter